MSVITSWREEHWRGQAALRKLIVFQRWHSGLVKTVPTHVTSQPKISSLYWLPSFMCDASSMNRWNCCCGYTKWCFCWKDRLLNFNWSDEMDLAVTCFYLWHVTQLLLSPDRTDCVFCSDGETPAKLLHITAHSALIPTSQSTTLKTLHIHFSSLHSDHPVIAFLHRE